MDVCVQEGSQNQKKCSELIGYVLSNVVMFNISFEFALGQKIDNFGRFQHHLCKRIYDIAGPTLAGEF